MNGNVLCFDSAELKALDQNANISGKEKDEYLSMIKVGYEEVARQMIETSNKRVEQYREEQKRKAREKYEKDNEYEEAVRKIDKKCERTKIKQVTIGSGYWAISKKLSALYKADGKRIEGEREDGTLAKPIESIGYLGDSNVQYELARATGVKNEEIKYNMNADEQEHLYRDERIVLKEGGKILRDTLSKVKEIENTAHKTSMRMINDIDIANDPYAIEKLENKYEVEKGKLEVICGEDWYYIYSQNDSELTIHDAARNPNARVKGEETTSQFEMIKGFYDIMKKADENNKTIKAQLREDTSYVLYQQLLNAKGEVEQVGEERVYKFEDEMGVKVEKEEDKTTMHEVVFKVTDIGRQKIKRMDKREKRNDTDERG